MRRCTPHIRTLVSSSLVKEVVEWRWSSKSQTSVCHDACRLVGHCAEVPTFYHALDLLAQSSEYEGTPNVVLEGMALGTPVVATDAGGTADLLRDGIDGRIVPRLDTVRLSKALSDAVSNPARRRAWVQSARARVESELSFTSRMGKVEAQYERLVRNGGRRCEELSWSAAGRF